MRIRNLACLFSMIVMLGATSAQAAETFTAKLVADFQFNFRSPGPLAFLYDEGGPLHGVPTDTFIDFQATGSFVFELDDALNDPAAATVPFVSATGTLNGVTPGSFLPFTIAPTEFLTGDLTNIVRDGGGNVTSADVTNLSMEWDLLQGEGPDPTRFYTAGGLPFNGHIDSVPFSVGTVLAGPADFDVFIDVGAGEDNPLAIIGRNRELTVVPEPGALSLAVLGLLGLLGFTRRRRK